MSTNTRNAKDYEEAHGVLESLIGILNELDSSDNDVLNECREHIFSILKNADDVEEMTEAIKGYSTLIVREAYSKGYLKWDTEKTGEKLPF